MQQRVFFVFPICVSIFFFFASPAFAQGNVWRDHYHDDFNNNPNQDCDNSIPGNRDWFEYTRGGAISWNGYLNLSADSNTSQYPIVMNAETSPSDCIPPNDNSPFPTENFYGFTNVVGSWQRQADWRVRYSFYSDYPSGAAAYGVSPGYSYPHSVGAVIVSIIRPSRFCGWV